MAFPLEAHDVGVRATGTSTDLFNLMAANRKNSALNDGVESAVFTMLVTVIGLSVNISFISAFKRLSSVVFLPPPPQAPLYTSSC